MPRLCLPCASPRRQELDRALMLHQESYRSIAKRFGVSDASVLRHERNHLHSAYQAVMEAHAMSSAEQINSDLAEMRSAVFEVLQRARGKDGRLVLLAVDRGAKLVEILMRLDDDSDAEARLAALERRARGEVVDGLMPGE